MDVSKTYSLPVFEGETKISTASYPGNFTIETVRFSPFAGLSLVFYFEACHTTTSSLSNLGRPRVYSSEIVLKLIKEPISSKLYPSSSMNVNVTLFYSDGSLFKKYPSLSNLIVDRVTSITFETVSCSNSQLFEPTPHSLKMKGGDLTLKCKLLFNDDIPKSALSKNVSGSLSFSNNLKSVYENSVFDDFVINVGDKSFSVHKVILVAHSPVFMKMMTQDCLESKTNSVNITDYTPEILDLFLKYLYSGAIGDKSWPSVKDLYCLADKYDVEILKNDCTDIIISLMSVELVCEILKIAYTYADLNLKSAARNFAFNNIKELISREDWKTLVEINPIIGYEVLLNFVPN